MHQLATAPFFLRRRTVLAASLCAAGLATLSRRGAVAADAWHEIGNVTGLGAVRVARVAAPTTLDGIVQALQSWPGQVAVGGARFSMGGQTAVHGGLHLDLRGLRRLVWLDVAQRRVRVQAGMTWRDLQDHLDPHGLAVRTMQSYANFTVGGSVSVNAHGRYVGHGPVGHTVRALQLVLADGRVVEASRSHHPGLFRAALGGYGAVGVIAEVELDLDENGRIERSTADVPLADYPAYFDRVVRATGCLLHNADLLPPHFDAALVTNWTPTGKPVTESRRLVPRDADYDLERKVIHAVSEWPNGAKLQRQVVRPALQLRPAVAWRNHEASLDTASLEPASRRDATYALQEYFIPVRHFHAFARDLADVLRRHDAKVLNVSIRHSPPDRDALMAWAREEVFSFVLYFKQKTGAAAQQAVGVWTRALIDAALRGGGTYYLPYQLHATQAQFDAAYPQAGAFRAVKARADPAHRFSNELWRRYL